MATLNSGPILKAPGSTWLTTTLHCATPVRLTPASTGTANADRPIAIAVITACNEAPLLNFIFCLQSWGGIVFQPANMYALGLQFASESLPLTFIQLADRSVKPSVGIEVVQCQKVVLLVSE